MHGNTEEEKLFVFRMRGGRKIDGPRDRKYYSRFLTFVLRSLMMNILPPLFFSSFSFLSFSINGLESVEENIYSR